MTENILKLRATHIVLFVLLLSTSYGSLLINFHMNQSIVTDNFTLSSNNNCGQFSDENFLIRNCPIDALIYIHPLRKLVKLDFTLELSNNVSAATAWHQKDSQNYQVVLQRDSAFLLLVVQKEDIWVREFTISQLKSFNNLRILSSYNHFIVRHPQSIYLSKSLSDIITDSSNEITFNTLENVRERITPRAASMVSMSSSSIVCLDVTNQMLMVNHIDVDSDQNLMISSQDMTTVDLSRLPADCTNSTLR